MTTLPATCTRKKIPLHRKTCTHQENLQASAGSCLLCLLHDVLSFGLMLLGIAFVLSK